MEIEPNRNFAGGPLLGLRALGDRVLPGIFQVPGKDDKTLEAIEVTQAALRDSIEEAKKLAEKSDRLIKQHRKAIES
jgi:hypothetical protein